jgi:predicted nucleic acid-binding protein
MSTVNRVFIDSSVLIEYYKNTETDLLNRLLAQTNIQLLINQVVLSEFSFHQLAIKGNKSPLSVKQSAQISTILSDNNPKDFLNLFTALQNGNEIISEYIRFMQQYNLLPNDALILATCKLNDIIHLASFDADFEEPCKSEGIILLSRQGQLL